ncbi:MAG: hypothetical protein K0S71_2865 [Clostridia bacterium]|jgi:hypothetical protein|nr:hypothetical protein [Clostridia bacterium]
MNKIRIIYDVVRKMKEKDSVKGVIKAEGLKDQNRILSINNTFEKNMQDGQIKGTTSIEVDYDGKKMKMENSIDFQGEGCCGHHNFMKHMHDCHHNGAHRGGLKEGLGRLSAVLGILSSIKINEKEDGSVVLVLVSADIPEDIKSGICDKMKEGCEHHKHLEGTNGHHMCMKEFHAMENIDFMLNVFINKHSEVEKITIDISGEQKDEKDEKKEMKLTADLSLEW